MSPSDLIGSYPHIVVMGTGLAFGFLVGRMILAHLCDEPKGLKSSMSMSLFYLPLAIGNARIARLNDGKGMLKLLGWFIHMNKACHLDFIRQGCLLLTFKDHEDMLEDTWNADFPRTPDVSDGL